MNVNPLKVNIELKSDDINSKWYAKKDVSKDKETTVTFFQREGKRTFLQKIKDFKNGVRYGTELASKYSKELGLSGEVFSNPKNKSEKPTISNDDLNKIFREAHAKFKNDEPFQKSDPLVSRSSKKIEVSIDNELILKGKDFKNTTLRFFSSKMVNANKNYSDFRDHIALALDIRANPKFTDDDGKIDKAIEALKELKEINLVGYEHAELTDYNNRKFEFNEKIDSLIIALNKAT